MLTPGSFDDLPHCRQSFLSPVDPRELFEEFDMRCEDSIGRKDPLIAETARNFGVGEAIPEQPLLMNFLTPNISGSSSDRHLRGLKTVSVHKEVHIHSYSR
jgi:hypothetical protein